MGFRNHGSRPNVASTGGVLTDKWQRYSFSVKVGRCPNGKAIINIGTGTWMEQKDFSKRSIWIDAVQLEEGGLSEFQTASGVEISGGTSLKHSVFVEGEPIRIITRFSIQENIIQMPSPKKWHLEYQFENVFGEIVDTRSVIITPKSKQTFERSFLWDTPLLGSFCGHATLKDGDKILARAIDVLAVVPKLPPANPKRPSIFGCHVNLSLPYLEIAKRIGVRSTRLHADRYFRWINLKQNADNPYWYDYSRELVLKQMKQAGIHILGVLEMGVPWASTAPDTVKGFARRAYPPELNAWRTFVADQTRHFEGMIGSWEVWNEPYHTRWWKGTAEEYVEILRVAYEEIKKVNSSIPVVGICGQPSIDGWVKDCLDAGALKYMDVFSYHRYLTFESGPEESRPSWRDVITSLKQDLVKRGKPIPVWNSEGAVNCHSYLPLADRMRSLVSGQLPSQAAGVLSLDLPAGHADLLVVA